MDITEPLRDLVVIRADEPKKQTESGLLVYEQWDTVPPTGTIVAVGPLVEEVSVGDRVLFERYGALMPKGKDDLTRVCKESGILAKGVK